MNVNINLQSMLSSSAQKDPDHPFFIQKNTRTSYGELHRTTGRLAAGLKELGVKPADRVALVLENSVEYITSYYAILKAGATVVPLCPDTRTGTLSFALNHCQASAVVLGGNNSKLLRGQSEAVPSLELVVCVGTSALESEGRFRVMEYSSLFGADDEIHGEGIGSEELASIIYTSGTTARPKGVMLSHRNLAANTLSIVEYLELAANDSIAMVLPFFYSYGNSILHTHLCVGGTVVALGSMAFPAAVLAGIQTYRCTGLSGVPSTFARLIQSSVMEKFDLSSLRYITQAGGPMTPALTQKLRAAMPRAKIFVMYGQTEAAARLSYLPPKDLDRKLGSAGIGIPGVTLRILDGEGNEVPRGTVGEIVATGENIMPGYWNNPEETARVLRPEGLRTADLATMDEEGFVFIVGRDSDMIKSGSHRIGPKEIEDVVEKLPGVSQCAVVGVPDELLGEAIVAFVVPVKDATLTDRDVMRICHEHLPRFKLPRFVRMVDTLPKTDTGKLKRKELKEWFAAGTGVKS